MSEHRRMTVPSPRQCEKADGDAKHTWPTRAAARAARKLLNGSHVVVYACPIHGGWHLGRNPERRRP